MGRALEYDDLLGETLRVISATLEAHRDEARWREIVACGGRSRGSLTFGVGVCDEASQRVVDRYEIRLLGSCVEVVDHGHSERPIDWRVSTEDLRRIAAQRDRCVEAPDELGLAWLESRLRLAPTMQGAPSGQGGARA